MKVDMFEAIVLAYVFLIACLAALDAGRWLDREWRSGGLKRRLHRLGLRLGEAPPPQPEVEVHPAQPATAARRSLARHQDLRRRLRFGWGHWGQIQHRDS